MSSSSEPLPTGVQAEKDKFLDMPMDKKRSCYRCQNNYFTLDKIVDWKEYFTNNNVQQVEVQDGKREVNDELNSKVSLWEGDITTLEIDAIVNAANNTLLGGGGVDGAIHRAAGIDLLNECRELNGCLTAKYVIQTVGPRGEKPDDLRSCYLNSMQRMLDTNLRSIAFPCISTGIYGYPPMQAAHVALTTVREVLEKHSDKVDRVIFTLFLQEDKKIYEQLMQKYFPLQ